MVLARRLGVIAIALFVLYVASVLARIIPVRLFLPSWQLDFAAALIDAGPTALLGLVLIHLAHHIDPHNAGLQARRRRAANLAIAAALGFLLLIPLDIYAVWAGLKNLQLTRTRVEADATRKVAQFRQVIDAASTPADLQQRLATIGVPPLKPADLRQPLPQLKQRLLENIDRAEANLASRRADSGAVFREGTWSVLQSALKLGVSSLALALAFAAAGQRGTSQISLLDSWTRWGKRRQRQSRQRAAEATAARHDFHALHESELDDDA